MKERIMIKPYCLIGMGDTTDLKEDITFVSDEDIIKKPRNPQPKPEKISAGVRRRRRSNKVERKRNGKARKS